MTSLQTSHRQATRRGTAPVDTGAFLDGGAIPAPESRSRVRVVHLTAVVGVLASLAYLVWRAAFTLGSELWISVPMWLLELSAVVSLGLFVFSLWDLDAASPPEPIRRTDRRVAVLIPTYNEPREVLLPTVAAAVALAPAHETWVLDDGDRTWVRELADSLGARYLARPDHAHAKAGNVNYALGVVEADVVAVLDADHVATPNFLSHTLGYFEDPKVAVVQTPQDFYNVASFEHAPNRSWLWRERRAISFNEQRLFYRAIQPGKNRWNAAFWCGTGALVRTDALRMIGGVAEETVTEDMHTTIRLHRRGWRTVYHNEVLAYGLAARNANEYQSQRNRWGTGAMQILHAEHPLTGKGLSLGQRIAYASTILGWFDAWRSLGFVLVPIAVMASGAIPIRAQAVQFAVVFAATFLLQRLALATLSRGYAPQGMAVLFEFVRMQSNILATLTYVMPHDRSFRVTTKERSGERQRIPAPRLLLWLLVATVAAWVWFALTLAGVTPLTYQVPWTAYGAAGWAAVNGAFLVGAIARIRSDRYATERRASVRMAVAGDVAFDGAEGSLVDVSVGGALVRVTKRPDSAPGAHELRLTIGEAVVSLQADVCGYQVISPANALVMLRFRDGQDRAIAALSTAVFGGSSRGGDRARARIAA